MPARPVLNYLIVLNLDYFLCCCFYLSIEMWTCNFPIHEGADQMRSAVGAASRRKTNMGLLGVCRSDPIHTKMDRMVV
jgi:hypothetical protein